MEFRYCLDKSSKKYKCPSCGKKRFVLYIDKLTKNYVSERHGRCDREQSCTYHLIPESNNLVLSPIKIYNNHQNKSVCHVLPVSLVSKTLCVYNKNNFVLYLLTMYDTTIVKQLINDYKVGTSKRWLGSTLFWLIDINNKVRSGKVMLFNQSNGKRVKQPYVKIDWVHKILERNNNLPEHYELKQCLFGEHLINNINYSNKVVAIVESEKTALIMAIEYPKYLWLSCGSVNGIKETMLLVVKNKTVVLFPDKACYSKWEVVAERLNSKGFNISVSTIVELSNAVSGADLADLFLSEDISNNTVADVSNNTVLQKPISKHIYDSYGNLIEVTPDLQYFIDKFDLVNE